MLDECNADRSGGGESIRTERLNAASALERAFAEISALFDQAEDAYLRERRGDVSDVVGRLCMNLRAGGDSLEAFNDLEGPLVLVADELPPSVIAQLDWQQFAAFVTDAGAAGPTTRRSWRDRLPRTGGGWPAKRERGDCARRGSRGGRRDRRGLRRSGSRDAGARPDAATTSRAVREQSLADIAGWRR